MKMQLFALSQNQKDSLYLHLVMFTSKDLFTYFEDPTNDEEMDSTKKAFLWRVEGDTLIMLDTLNFNHGRNSITEMYQCRQFTEKKWIYIMEHEFFPTYYVPEPTQQDSFLDEDTFISVLDYSGSEIIIRRLRGSEYSPFHVREYYPLEYMIGIKLYHTYSQAVHPLREFIISKMLNDGYEIKATEYIDSFYVKRESGTFYRYNPLYFISKNNEIKNRVYNMENFNSWEDWPENKMNIPVSDSEHDIYSRFEFLLHTPQNRYVIGKKQRRKPNPDSLEQYYILDKNTEIWDTIYMSNGVKNFNIYKDRYLYGTLWKKCIYCKDPKTVKDSVLAIIRKYPRKYSWKYANYPNLTHSSGKIFIYDIENRKYEEMRLDDIDAEFLEIIDGWIYYRVYDEIRKMKLGKNGNLFDKTGIKVLIKNKEVIPNVHHIFLKKKSKVVEEWITPNPHEKELKLKLKNKE